MEWMYEDAIFMKENGRLKGCLCLLLCLIDGLAAEAALRGENNKTRYCRYLREKLAEIGLDSTYRIEEENRMIHISEIIYIYFRCNMVHEADARDDDMYEVQLEYEASERYAFADGIIMDRPREKIIVKAEWLVDVLSAVAVKGLGT